MPHSTGSTTRRCWPTLAFGPIRPVSRRRCTSTRTKTGSCKGCRAIPRPPCAAASAYRWPTRLSLRLRRSPTCSGSWTVW